VSGNNISQALLSDLLEELGQLEQRVKEIKQRVKETKKNIQKLPFEALAKKDIETIPVNKDGERIVLVRMKACPEFAFAIYTERNHGSRWNLRINSSRGFSVCCACCGIENYGIELPKGEEERVARLLELQAALHAELQRLCQEYKISHLFFRHAEQFEDKFGNVPGVAILEANEYSKVMLELYDRKQVKKACEILQIY